MTLEEPLVETAQPTRPASAEKAATALSETIIEIISDSGEGAQKCGQSLGSIAAKMGYGIWTVEIIPAEGAFDYEAKYIAKATQEICPARFAPEVNAQLMDHALRAHKALSCGGYSRTDFIISDKGPIFLETNTLPGLTKASLYPKALKAQGIEFADFLKDQIVLAERRTRR